MCSPLSLLSLLHVYYRHLGVGEPADRLVFHLGSGAQERLQLTSAILWTLPLTPPLCPPNGAERGVAVYPLIFFFFPLSHSL